MKKPETVGGLYRVRKLAVVAISIVLTIAIAGCGKSAGDGGATISKNDIGTQETEATSTPNKSILPTCDCKARYAKGQVVLGATNKPVLVSKTKMDDEYSAYSRMGKIENLQIGSKLIILKGTSYGWSASFSVSPNLPLPTLKSSLGLKFETTTVNLSGIASPSVKKGRQWVSAYARKAYHCYKVTDRVDVYCSHGVFLGSKNQKTYVAKSPYKDGAYLRFGAAKEYSGLPSSVSGKDNPLFVW